MSEAMVTRRGGGGKAPFEYIVGEVSKDIYGNPIAVFNASDVVVGGYYSYLVMYITNDGNRMVHCGTFQRVGDSIQRVSISSDVYSGASATAQYLNTGGTFYALSFQSGSNQTIADNKATLKFDQLGGLDYSVLTTLACLAVKLS